MLGRSNHLQVDFRLCAAALAKDEARALQHAVRWFSKTDIADIVYDDHRFIAAVGRRFPSATELEAFRTIILNVSKQLWIRATDNLRSVVWLADYLTDYHVPWAFVGNLAWQDSSSTLFNDCDLPELIVPSEAFSHVVLTLWRNSWSPPEGIDIYDPSKPAIFWAPQNKSLRLWSDHGLRRGVPTADQSHPWETVRTQRVYQHDYPVLDVRFLRQQTLLREPRDLQWLIDLKMIHETGDMSVQVSPKTLEKFQSKQKTFYKVLRA